MRKPKFKVGDYITKPKGYQFPGVVVAVFKNLMGERRVVAELLCPGAHGMLHIFNEDQLEIRKIKT